MPPPLRRRALRSGADLRAAGALLAAQTKLEDVRTLSDDGRFSVAARKRRRAAARGRRRRRRGRGSGSRNSDLSEVISRAKIGVFAWRSCCWPRPHAGKLDLLSAWSRSSSVSSRRSATRAAPQFGCRAAAGQWPALHGARAGARAVAQHAGGGHFAARAARASVAAAVLEPQHIGARQSAAAAPSAAPSAAPRAVMVARRWRQQMRRHHRTRRPPPPTPPRPPTSAPWCACRASSRSSRRATACSTSCMREAAGAEHARLLIVERGQLCLHDVTDARGVLLVHRPRGRRPHRTGGGAARAHRRPPGGLRRLRGARRLAAVARRYRSVPAASRAPVHGGDVLGVVQLATSRRRVPQRLHGGRRARGGAPRAHRGNGARRPRAALGARAAADARPRERDATLGGADGRRRRGARATCRADERRALGRLHGRPRGGRAVHDARHRARSAAPAACLRRCAFRSPSASPATSRGRARSSARRRPRRHSSSSESSSSPPPSTESSPRSLSGSPQAVQRAAAHGFRRSPAGEKRRARSRLGPGLADELNTAYFTEAANGSPLLMSPDPHGRQASGGGGGGAARRPTRGSSAGRAPRRSAPRRRRRGGGGGQFSRIFLITPRVRRGAELLPTSHYKSRASQSSVPAWRLMNSCAARRRRPSASRRRGRPRRRRRR